MPCKINTTNQLTDNAAAMAQENCPMCGAQKAAPGETDREEHSDLEIVRRLALFMADDWKACCILMLYVASPNAPVRSIAARIRLSTTSVHEAKQRAAAAFPALSGMLGLKSPIARAQQQRYAREKQNTQPNLF